MIPVIFRKGIAFAVALSVALPVTLASADTKEVKRTERSPDKASTDLRENIYRTETYQDSYTEQVSYQEEEVYYEQVPYQEQETYIEQEEYWEVENICRDETRYEQRCENHRRCVPRFEHRCERRRVCQIMVPGALKAALALFQVSAAYAQQGPDPAQDERRRREEEERRNREENERREREQNERRNREQGQRREREQNERRNREENQRREREQNERRGREENQRREREQNERRGREENQRREREQNERRNREENERREREERERREREQGQRGQNERREREERERREREERERREREQREHGQHQRCHREVCEDVQVGEDCSQTPQCERIPRTERVCHDENVRKTRPVQRTRWVTKYREERRTRMVTKYRDEVRCCVTKQREVLDHRIKAHVELQFPPQATLARGESETFDVSLKEVAGRPEVTVAPDSVIYTYQPQVQQISTEQYVVHMQLVPTYHAADLGAQSIVDVAAASVGSKLRLSFTDKGVVRKARTDYVLHLINPADGSEYANLPVADQKQVNATFDFNLNLPVGTPLLVRMEVSRNGAVIDAPVAFTKDESVAVTADTAYDPRPYMDKHEVGKFSLEGRTVDLVVFFRDLTADIPQVRTEYHYKISLGRQVLAEKVFNRADLTVQPDGRIPLAGSTGFGIAEPELRLLTAGKTITVEGQVIRYGSRFPNGQYSISKSVNLTIE